ncbi:MAG: RNA-binding S4 domain-containing protein [Actinomycetaceae bacterium]|mgnify:CR=1 FL=1|nr:RNA-binding S4 domain-containing protein [Actinomycetaceae bacterium]MDU0970054.1 RNA-binding S4 domain-containing protein [Actinomycetaceae bacterium]
MDQTLSIPVRCPIKLGQFIKLSGIVEDGAEAALAIAGGHVLVNGEPETRRGHRLVGDEDVRVVMPDDSVCRLVIEQV